MSGPPDPSQPNKLEATIRDIVMQTLSDPMGYPDNMVSWFQDQFLVQAPSTVNSTTAVPSV